MVKNAQKLLVVKPEWNRPHLDYVCIDRTGLISE
jgi:hypothetical protein